MKEKDLLKSVTDLQMPDLEQIRKNVIESKGVIDEKPKIVKLKPTKMLAVAAVVALAVIGTVAAVAYQNGGFFAPRIVETTVPDTTQPVSTVAKTEDKTPKKTSEASLTPAQKKAARIKEYKERLSATGFKVNWLYDLGKVEDYHIVYAGNGDTLRYDCDYVIGSYTFSTGVQQSPYGLGLYACGKNGSYKLSAAYKKGIFENFSAVAETVSAYSEKDLGITVTEKKASSESFRNYLGGKDIVSLAKIASNDSYELYFTVPHNAPKSSKAKIIGDYTFFLTAEQDHYDLGLYVVSEGSISTLEEAVENGVITMDEAFAAINENGAVPYNFHVSKEEEEATEENTHETDDNSNEEETTVAEE